MVKLGITAVDEARNSVGIVVGSQMRSLTEHVVPQDPSPVVYLMVVMYRGVIA